VGGFFNLFGELLKTAQLVHPDRNVMGGLKRVKYCLRGLAFGRCTSEWFMFLRRHGLDDLAGKHPHLFHKLQRPYPNRTFNTRQRLEALKQHYRFATASFPPSVLIEIHSQQGMLLAGIPIQGSGSFGLYLSSSWGQKEGDLKITLQEQDSAKVLFSLSFSVLEFMEIFIGGLQGRKTVDKSLLVSVTRGLYGLRPKALLVFALQQLADCWEVTRIRAVSDDLQVYRHVQKRREILASYDEFWTETGGVLAPDGVFDLPSRFFPRETAAIKANKRKMYLRRYEMLAGIADKIRSRITSLKTTAIPQYRKPDLDRLQGAFQSLIPHAEPTQ